MGRKKVKLENATGSQVSALRCFRKNRQSAHRYRRAKTEKLFFRSYEACSFAIRAHGLPWAFFFCRFAAASALLDECFCLLDSRDQRSQCGGHQREYELAFPGEGK